ncbi:hypothetical protein GFY24_33150 [Nocardia sp. SYP-A9097]|uniref:hypothetical protein n=1 Tax=Nocardia sp. SYP-A9097 TaxID=2663237 RepID=UPI00129B49A6|nr:hypothetical protein [Nocardia sp. SYP-A9097]MRH92227.1 hypothetical protein [Nocardia sp. SYP-A9097]
MGIERVRVRCVLVYGDGETAVAYLETPWHPARSPLAWAAQEIAGQAGLPTNELPGREFWVDVQRLPEGALRLSGFLLVFDPRL